MDFKRSGRTAHAPLLIQGVEVERVENIKFLGISGHHLGPEPGEEGSTKTFLPLEVEAGWTLLSAADTFL